MGPDIKGDNQDVMKDKDKFESQEEVKEVKGKKVIRGSLSSPFSSQHELMKQIHKVSYRGGGHETTQQSVH